MSCRFTRANEQLTVGGGHNYNVVTAVDELVAITSRRRASNWRACLGCPRRYYLLVLFIVLVLSLRYPTTLVFWRMEPQKNITWR